MAKKDGEKQRVFSWESLGEEMSLNENLNMRGLKRIF